MLATPRDSNYYFGKFHDRNCSTLKSETVRDKHTDCWHPSRPRCCFIYPFMVYKRNHALSALANSPWTLGTTSGLRSSASKALVMGSASGWSWTESGSVSGSDPCRDPAFTAAAAGRPRSACPAGFRDLPLGTAEVRVTAPSPVTGAAASRQSALSAGSRLCLGRLSFGISRLRESCVNIVNKMLGSAQWTRYRSEDHSRQHNMILIRDVCNVSTL